MLADHTSIAGLTPDAARRLLEIGRRWSDDINAGRRAVLELYTPLLAAVPRDGIARHPGIAYGAHPRQVLDVHVPQDASNAPVLVFVHGGAFVRGDMNSNDEIYGNVLRFAARHGMVGINVEYRLAPEAPYPEGGRDIARAMEWVREHVASYGGDPSRIVLMGHSAGGAHAAAYASDPLVRPPQGHGLAGLVLVSGRLRADVRPDNPNAAGVRAYWGTDATAYEDCSPVSHARRIDLPLMIAVAEFENPHLDTYAAEYHHRVLQAGRIRPRFVQVAGHNHTSIVAHLDTGDMSFAAPLLDFMHSATAPR